MNTNIPPVLVREQPNTGAPAPGPLPHAHPAPPFAYKVPQRLVPVSVPGPVNQPNSSVGVCDNRQTVDLAAHPAIGVHAQDQSVGSSRSSTCLVPTVSPLVCSGCLESTPPLLEVSRGVPQPVGGAENSGQALHPQEAPKTVEVVCGPLRGTFLVELGKVRLQEDGGVIREVSPTEMERLGGKGSAKKWKATLRVVNADGTVGRPIGDWFKKRGIELKSAIRPVLKTKKLAQKIKQVKLQAGQTQASSDREEREAQWEAMRKQMEAHLDKCYVGFRSGDPTATSIPKFCDAADNDTGNVLEVNLNKMSYEQLLILSKANGSGGGAASALLPNPPGVLPGREGYVSGQAPKRRHVAKERAENLALMGEYLSGQRACPPWDALGADKPPTLADHEVDLRKLYRMVRDSGGFDEVNASRRWPKLAEQMDMDGGLSISIGYGLRSVYQRFLLRFERQESALNQFNAPKHTASSTHSKGDSNSNSNTSEMEINGKAIGVPPPIRSMSNEMDLSGGESQGSRDGVGELGRLLLGCPVPGDGF